MSESANLICPHCKKVSYNVNSEGIIQCAYCELTFDAGDAKKPKDTTP